MKLLLDTSVVVRRLRDDPAILVGLLFFKTMGLYESTKMTTEHMVDEAKEIAACATYRFGRKHTGMVD